MAHRVQVGRVYDEASATDGARVLVDRIWPRGLNRQQARLDEWLREVAPSNELRQWYRHDPDRFPQFRSRYLAELDEPGRQQALQRLRQLAGDGDLTLLTASRDVEHSQAAVLAELL